MPVATDPGADAALLLRARDFAASATQRVGVAVSGGGDSMAVLHLLARTGAPLFAVTVDHRLRAEAAAEAAFVARICKELGVPHQVLVWDHGPVPGNLMDAARQARYGLMAAWAAAQGVGDIALGHTADDQAETFLMGLSRAAGLDGLCGMRPSWMQAGVRFCRPYLHTSRVDLRAYLMRHAVPWVEDPTNEAAAYTRTKARRALKALVPLGITVDRLSAVVGHLSLAQGAVRHALAQAADDLAYEVAGALLLDREKLRLLQPELHRRLLIAALLWVSGAAHAPRAAAVDRLCHAVRQGRAATLWGCRIRILATGVQITREPRAVAVATAISTATGTLWDGRWHVSGPPGEIRALGQGLRQISDWRATGLPRAVLEVTPAIWHGDTLIAAPLAGFGEGGTATVRPTFVSFLLSH